MNEKERVIYATKLCWNMWLLISDFGWEDVEEFTERYYLKEDLEKHSIHLSVNASKSRDIIISEIKGA